MIFPWHHIVQISKSIGFSTKYVQSLIVRTQKALRTLDQFHCILCQNNICSVKKLQCKIRGHENLTKLIPAIEMLTRHPFMIFVYALRFCAKYHILHKISRCSATFSLESISMSFLIHLPSENMLRNISSNLIQRGATTNYSLNNQGPLKILIRIWRDYEKSLLLLKISSGPLPDIN